jgi:hypothetical protein
MPSTFQAILVTLLAVLPGAIYTWGFEQEAGRWGATAVDRVQRFVGVSAFFLVLELSLIYQFYRRFVVTGDVSQGRPLPVWLWFMPVLFVIIPAGIGRFVGRAAYQRKPWVTVITGPSPAPRAWDVLFSGPDMNGWIRLQLKDKSWVAGLWGESATTGLKSYAAGYPEDQDLLVSELVETDAGGNLVTGEDGAPVLTGRSLLIRWDEIVYAEYIPG